MCCDSGDFAHLRSVFNLFFGGRRDKVLTLGLWHKRTKSIFVHGTVPFLSHKSVCVVFSRIILPLKNMTTWTIHQSLPFWDRRSLCHSTLIQCGRTFIWINSAIGAYSTHCFWYDCKGLLHLTAQSTTNVGFKSEEEWVNYHYWF